jgi:tetratricopeptide (TPR) repeat protein
MPERRLSGLVAMVLLALAVAAPAYARGDKSPKVPKLTDAGVAEEQRAIDEQRYVDAGRMLDKAGLAGVSDPRLTILSGELNLAKGRLNDALVIFKRVEGERTVRAKSLQGQGVVLSLLNRDDEAIAMLEAAVAEDPGSWRAWNALGSQYDSRRDFARAQTAYDHALMGSNGAAAVLNNRGFSRLLQGQIELAIKDFVEALNKKPDLAAARTNLRLAIAMKGEYDRALAGGAPTDEAARLNNAGFAAMLRGDYAKAEDLFTQAMKTRGEYYTRASANLEMTRALAARQKASTSAAP